jgi:hypothetical protein
LREIIFKILRTTTVTPRRDRSSPKQQYCIKGAHKNDATEFQDEEGRRYLSCKECNLGSSSTASKVHTPDSGRMRMVEPIIIYRHRRKLERFVALSNIKTHLGLPLHQARIPFLAKITSKITW